MPVSKYVTKLFSIFISIILVGTSAIAQNNDHLVLQSLEFLNQKFHLNLEKENEIIFIQMNNSEEYICLKYTEKTNLPDLSKTKWHYQIKALTNNKYEFILNSSSEYKGTFETVIRDQTFTFINLRFVKRND